MTRSERAGAPLDTRKQPHAQPEQRTHVPVPPRQHDKPEEGREKRVEGHLHRADQARIGAGRKDRVDDVAEHGADARGTRGRGGSGHRVWRER